MRWVADSPANPNRIFARWVERYWLDVGAQDWYTRRVRSSNKPLILLYLLKLRGNPSLSTAPSDTTGCDLRQAQLCLPAARHRVTKHIRVSKVGVEIG